MKKNVFFAVLITFLNLYSLYFEHEDAGWILDVPEEYEIDSANYPVNVKFRDQSGYLTFNVYNISRGKADFFVKEKLIKHLSLEGELKSYSYGGVTTRYGFFSQELPEGKGLFNITVFEGLNGYSQVILGAVPAEYADNAAPEMESFADSFSPSEEHKYEPGIIARIAAPFPQKGSDKYDISFNGLSFKTDFSGEDIECMDKILEREKRIIMQYKKPKPKVMSRFYRIVYRNAYPKFNTFVNSLERYFKKNKMNKSARYHFLYNGVYSLNTKVLGGKDFFASPFDVLLTASGDCDSKSLLLHILLDHFNIESELLVSYTYRHAAIGIPESLFGDNRTGFIESSAGDSKLVFVELLNDELTGNQKDMSDPSQWHSFKVRQ